MASHPSGVSTAPLGVICNLMEGVLNPTMSLEKILNSTGSRTNHRRTTSVVRCPICIWTSNHWPLPNMKQMLFKRWSSATSHPHLSSDSPQLYCSLHYTKPPTPGIFPSHLCFQLTLRHTKTLFDSVTTSAGRTHCLAVTMVSLHGWHIE